MQNGVKTITNAFSDVSARLKIRASIIESMIKAETQYVKTLKFIVDVIKSSLEFCSEQIEYEIEDGHIRALFGNVNELLDVHKSLLTELEKEAGGYGSDVPLISPEEQLLKICHCCLGKVFANAKESFKVYDIYCSNHARAEEVAGEILKMTSLQSIVKKWDNELPFPSERIKGSNALMVCLKEPLLHLCRTSVFLKSLAVFTSVSQCDLQDVLSSYSIVHATVTAIAQEKRAKLLQAAYKLCDELQQEWDNSGLMNKQGFLTKRGGSIKSWKIRWFTLRGYEMKYFEEPVDEKSLGTLNIRECKNVFETDSQSKPNCFGITLPDRTYFIYATTPVERMEWMNLIAWKVYVMRSAESKAQSALSVPALAYAAETFVSLLSSIKRWQTTRASKDNKETKVGAAHSGKAALNRRSWLDSHPSYVVASLDKMLHDDHPCLVDSDKYQMKEARRGTKTLDFLSPPRRAWINVLRLRRFFATGGSRGSINPKAKCMLGTVALQYFSTACIYLDRI